MSFAAAFRLRIVLELVDSRPARKARRPLTATPFGVWCVALAAPCLLAARAQADVMLVKNIVPDMGSSDPVALTNVGGTLFFTADDGVHRVLWKSDGTAAGTVPLQALSGWEDSGPDLSYAEVMEAVDDTLFFPSYAWAPSFLGDLWKSDGTAAGTFALLDLPADSPSPSLSELTASGGHLFFSVYHQGRVASWDPGSGLWKSDGTVPGTRQVKSFACCDVPQYLTDIRGTLFFAASDHGEKYGLWKTDGTESGTELVKEFAGSTLSGDFTDVQGTALFSVFKPSGVTELWRSDGTENGTVVVAQTDDPRFLTAVQGILFFTAADDEHGAELWKSDGTEAGTAMVRDINSGAAGSAPTDLTSVGGMLFFRADDGVHGAELWKSDGSAAGTVLVSDIAPGAAGSNPTFLTTVRDRLVFQACTDDGCEVWESDGSAAGTRQLADVDPGPSSSSPGPFVAAGRQVFFSAHDAVNGRELWALPIASLTACVGDCRAVNAVGVADLVEMVSIALGEAPLSECEAGDDTGDRKITVDELVTAVHNALNSCPGA